MTDTPPHKRPRFVDVAEKVIDVLRVEKNSEAHMILREYAGNEHYSKKAENVPGVTHPGATGVIYCTDRAMANGFTYDSPEWGNMGQGAPEVGPIPDAPEKPKVIDIEAMGEMVNEYAPTAGVKQLRDAVAVSPPLIKAHLSTCTTPPIGRARSHCTPTRMSVSSPVGVQA
jgi:hypothetical protein